MRTIDDCSAEEIKSILKPRNWWDRYNKIMLSKKDYTSYMLLKQHDFYFKYSFEERGGTITWHFCCRKCNHTLIEDAVFYNFKVGPHFCNILCLTDNELIIRDIIL